MLSVALVSLVASSLAAPEQGIHLQAARRTPALLVGALAPQSAPVPPDALPPPVPTEDPHLGTVVGKEMLVGGLTLFGSDLVAVGLTALSLLPSLILPVGALGIVFGAGLLLFHALVLSPLYCALAVKAMADEPTRNGFLGAVLGAYGASLVAGVLNLVVLLGLSAIVGPGNSIFVPVGPALIEDIVLFVVGGGMRYVGMPAAASWAMHLGSRKSGPTVASHTPPRWIPMATRDGREALAMFAW
ncbi:MAG: hypothetical protein ACJ790_20490 [Myxococcaceae bacterium]